MRAFALVVAVDLDGGIGKNGTLPWQLPGDMAFFKRITTEVRHPGKRNAVIMGRKTWESIPPKFRPLKNRLNIVVSRDPGFQLPGGVLLAGSLDQALDACDNDDVESVFVIGGGAIYQAAVEHPCCETVYFTEVRARFGCDTFFPSLDEKFFDDKAQASAVMTDNDTQYVFRVYKRKNDESRSPCSSAKITAT